jgi:hypothetical protein
MGRGTPKDALKIVRLAERKLAEIGEPVEPYQPTCKRCGIDLGADNPDRYCRDCYPYDQATDLAKRRRIEEASNFGQPIRQAPKKPIDADAGT